jgi:hypothetical protein
MVRGTAGRKNKRYPNRDDDGKTISSIADILRYFNMYDFERYTLFCACRDYSKPKLYISSVIEYSLMICGCRCIICKHQQLESFSFVAPDGFDEIHHTCLMCRTHFNHLDGETYSNCQACNYPPPPSSCIK